MHPTKLVAIWVAQVTQVHFADRTIAPARWVFAGRAAVGDAGRMECVTLFGGLNGKSDGAAIAVRCGRTIDGGRNGERPCRAPIEIPVLVGDPRTDTQCAQEGIVEPL